jgi:hypothetical protein
MGSDTITIRRDTPPTQQPPLPDGIGQSTVLHAIPRPSSLPNDSKAPRFSWRAGTRHRWGKWGNGGKWGPRHLFPRAGRELRARFKVELICIVDSLDKGILVHRDEKRSLPFSPLRAFHWAKRLFEGHYLRAYRA